MEEKSAKAGFKCYARTDENWILICSKHSLWTVFVPSRMALPSTTQSWMNSTNIPNFAHDIPKRHKLLPATPHSHTPRQLGECQ
ncbi:unnamed protein product [Camellia sinensis]